jgi:hypothetical protein
VGAAGSAAVLAAAAHEQPDETTEQPAPEHEAVAAS